MNITAVCAFAVFAVIAAAALRKYSGEIAGLMLTAAIVILAFMAIPYGERVLSSVSGFAESASVKTEYMEALVKSVGICFLTQITADICRDNGGSSVASQTELCGRIAILMIAAPLYSELIRMIGSFLID